MATLYSQANIRELIRDEINEPVARLFSNTQLNNIIDQGAMATAALALCEKTVESEALAANQVIYQLATDFITIESVTYHVDASTEIEYGVQRVHPAVFGHVVDDTAGPPKIWTAFRTLLSVSQVYIWPRPAGSTYTIKVRGTTVVAGDPANLDAGVQYLPFYYALSMVYARLGKHRLSVVHMQQFISECNQWRFDHEGAIKRVDSLDMGKIPDTTITPQ